ncbi:MAG TPA: acyl-CoA dehydratase activase, partial [bacterium]|nr:acyl-CoA dehydratase activase [bacterium]
MKAYVGIDVGAVSTNLAVLGTDLKLAHRAYLRTEGDPMGSVKRILGDAGRSLGEVRVLSCGTTGSGRLLAAALAGADVVRNEITAHAAASLHFFPEARTVIEIGGQDSKLIVIRDGIPVDFAMNTVCAAGTGSFLDHQAARMGITIQELAALASSAQDGVRIAGRCAVFAESDIIDRQQRGVKKEAILKGLCEALVRNYLAGVARGKPIEPPVVFQGGVASNKAVVTAFERELGFAIQVPADHDVMGAIGAALLAAREATVGKSTRFRGFEVTGSALASQVFECT